MFVNELAQQGRYTNTGSRYRICVMLYVLLLLMESRQVVAAESAYEPRVCFKDT